MMINKQSSTASVCAQGHFNCLDVFLRSHQIPIGLYATPVACSHVQACKHRAFSSRIMQIMSLRLPGNKGIVPCTPQKHRNGHKQHRNVCVGASSNWQGDLAFKRLMVLPGGAWFMSTDADAPVYGDSFIMQSNRHATAGQRGSHATGLVRMRTQRAMTAVKPQPSRDIIPLPIEDVEVSLVVSDGSPCSTTSLTLSTNSTSHSSSSIMPFRRLLADPDVTDDDLHLSVTSTSSTSLAIVPRDNTMLGVVMTSAMRSRSDDVSLPTDETVYETPFSDKNPRRTMKIKFKCRLCGATTIKPINPHAWAAGTVFAKCGCCQVTHKLIDNLKLFHELAGPVFGPGTQAVQPKRERLGLRLESDSTTLPQLPPRLRLNLPLDAFPDDTAGLN